MTTATLTGVAAAPDVAMCAVHQERLNRTEQRLEDQEDRLRALERAHWRMTGLVAAASAIASAGSTLLVGLLK